MGARQQVHKKSVEIVSEKEFSVDGRLAFLEITFSE
jgi:hypothetical protein